MIAARGFLQLTVADDVPSWDDSLVIVPTASVGQHAGLTPKICLTGEQRTLTSSKGWAK